MKGARLEDKKPAIPRRKASAEWADAWWVVCETVTNLSIFSWFHTFNLEILLSGDRVNSDASKADGFTEGCTGHISCTMDTTG